jgi:hypothetical protein
MEINKTCTKCQKTKDLNDFPKDKRGKNGLHAKCKDCKNAYYRKYLAGNVEHIARVNKQNRKYKNTVKQYKIEKGCYICGYNKCATSLHFHHRNPDEKVNGIANMTSRWTKPETLKAEIEKCDIVCANCHGEIEETKHEHKYA